MSIEQIIAAQINHARTGAPMPVVPHAHLERHTADFDMFGDES